MKIVSAPAWEVYSRWNVIETYKSRVNMDVLTKFLNIRTRWHSLRLEKDSFPSNKQHNFTNPEGGEWNSLTQCMTWDENINEEFGQICVRNSCNGDLDQL